MSLLDLLWYYTSDQFFFEKLHALFASTKEVLPSVEKKIEMIKLSLIKEE